MNMNVKADYKITGNLTDAQLADMVRLFSKVGALHSVQEQERVDAAKRILAHKQRVADRQAKTLRAATALNLFAA